MSETATTMKMPTDAIRYPEPVIRGGLLQDVRCPRCGRLLMRSRLMPGAIVEVKCTGSKCRHAAPVKIMMAPTA
jgi:phage FluMu protein Com